MPISAKKKILKTFSSRVNKSSVHGRSEIYVGTNATLEREGGVDCYIWYN